MKKTTRTARKVLSVFLAVLMMLTTWAVAVPGLVLAADGNKYYVKVYVNIYDGSDGYGGAYQVNETTGKPDNYSWATNDGWYGRINMTGFTVFGEGGDYDAQDVSAALLEAENLGTYYAMSGLSDNNADGDWDSKAIAKAEYTFTLDSFPVEIFWMNDENNWDGGNTGFAIRKLTVATSEGGTEHTMWEGLAGSDSETYNYYGSITPTGIHTCFEDYAKNYDMDDYKFYKSITTSSQRAWSDPYSAGSAGTYYLNDYQSGGVSATFSEGVKSIAYNVDYINTGSTDTYYMNFINHSKTQSATIVGVNNSDKFLNNPAGTVIPAGGIAHFELKNISSLGGDGGVANFCFNYTLDNVYASDALDASLAQFYQPCYIGTWNASDDSKQISDENGDGNTGFSLYKADNYWMGDNSMTIVNTFQTTEGILERNSATSGDGTDNATFNYNYYIDTTGITNWTQTGLRFHVKESQYYTLSFQPADYTDECGTITMGGTFANPNEASITIADIAYSSVTEDFQYNHDQASGFYTYADYYTKGTPMWNVAQADNNASFYNNSEGWFRFAGNMIKGSGNSAATINFSNMTYRDRQNGSKVYFSGTINVYAFDKTALRDYVRETLIDFAPMSLRYDPTAFATTYQEKLSNAMRVLAKQKTTQSEIDTALAELKSAVEALQTNANLVNQIDELTHIQYVDGIGSEIAAQTDARYVLIPLGEHTVPQKAEYIGNGAFRDATNKKSNLVTNYTKDDTEIDYLNYYYWNIDYSQVDGTIALVDKALENFDNDTYSSTLKTALENAKDQLEAIDQTTTGDNTPTSQEDVDNVIKVATDLLAHIGEGYEHCDYDANDDGENELKTKPSTCSEAGYTYYKCNICGKVQKVADLGLAEHSWDAGTETTAPECGNAGVITYTCLVCDATKTEPTTEIGTHDFQISDNGDGTHISKCSKCDANEEGATAEAHTYNYTNNADGTHTATCSVCKATVTEDHSFSKSVLTRPTLVDGVWTDGYYTRTCVCGATKTETAVRADYKAYDKAVADLNALLADDTLTDAAKAEIRKVLNDNVIADNYIATEQGFVDAAADALKVVLDKITDEEGNLADEYKKPDSTAAEEAVKNAEALEEALNGELPEDVKTKIDDLRTELNGILSDIEADDNATEAEYKERLEAVENAANEILDKYSDCKKNGHQFGEAVIVYPAYDEASDTWSKGTYTYTCEVCGYVKVETYDRASYEAYDKALADLDKLLADETITDATKADIRKVIANNTVADNLMTPDQPEVDAAAEALKAEVEKINGDTTGAYKKVDYSNYKAAVEAYEALDGVMTDADKAAVEAIKTEINAIPEDGTASQYQEQVDKAAADIAAINAKYGDCANGNHKWGEAELTQRPTQNDDGTWNNGTYTYTCDVCGETKTEVAERADYTEFDEALADLEKYLENEKLTESVKDQIESIVDGIKDGLYVYDYDQDGENDMRLDYVEAEEDKVKEITEFINDQLIAGIEKGLEEGTMTKPVFTEIIAEWEEYLTLVKQYGGEVEYATEGDSLSATVTDDGYIKDATNTEVTNGFNYLLEKAYNSDTATDAQWKDKIAEMTAELAAINEGIIDGTLRDPNFEAYDAEVKTYNEVTSKVNVSADDVAAVEAAKATVDAIKANPDATAKDSDATIAAQTAIIKAINEKYASCAAGNHDYADATCTEAKTCTVCGATEGTANGHTWKTEPDSYTLPVYDDETATWSQGEFIYGCEYCTETVTIYADRADYSEYDALVKAYDDIVNDESLWASLTDKTIDALSEYKGKLDSIALDYTKATIDAETGITTPDGQKELDALLEGLDLEIEKIQKSIEDGSGRMLDFSEFEEAVSEYEGDPDDGIDATIDIATPEDIAKATDIINTIRDLENLDPVPNAASEEQKQIDEATEEIRAIIDKYADCLANGHTWGAWAENVTVDADGKFETATYSRTCEKCGATEAYEVERENYDAYDNAVEKAEALLENKELTDAVKEVIQNALDEANALDQNLPADIVYTDEEGNEVVIDVNENAEAIEETTSTLNGVIDSLYDEDGELKDEYKKVDYSKYDAAVNAYENLKNTMTDADKAAVEAIKAPIDAIPEDGTAADYQTQVDEAAAKIAEINAKYGDCANGNHTWGEPVLTKNPTADAKGEYTETCTVCGATQITEVERADYDNFDEAVKALEDLAKTENLTDEAKTAIENALTKAEELDKNLPADVTTLGGQDVKGGQDEINALVTELNGVVADVTADIADGSALKPDYEAWEDAETAYDALDKTNVKDEIIAEADGLKADIAAKQGDDTLTQKTATQTQINEATARLNEIITGITDGSLRDPDYSAVEGKIDEANGKDNLNKDTQDKIKDIEKALEEIKTKTEPEANAKDDQPAVDALEEQLDNILESIKNGTATAPDYTEWDKAEATYTALDKTNAPADLVTEATNLKATIDALRADDTANATEDQPTINAATARLNEIIAKINGILTEKPDFSKYDESHDAYEELVKQYGDKIKDSVAGDVAALDAIVDGVRNDETATKVDDQPTVDNAKTQLDAIIAGIKDGSLIKDADFTNVKEDLETAKDLASKNDVIDGVDDRITNIENAIDALENDPTTNATKQDVIDALEKQLEAIIDGINDGTLVKPDYDDAENDLADAKNKAENNDVIDGVEEDIAKLEEELEDIENDGTATKADDQDDVDAIEKALEDIIAGIEDGSLVKPDYNDAENAIENAENYGDKLSDEDQKALEGLKGALEEIRNNPDTNKKDNQDDVNEIKDAAQAIVEKYAECDKGNHAWGTGVLTRPTEAGAWADGYYTYTCTVCGETKTEPVARAVYEAYDKAVADLNALLADDTLTDAAKDEIRDVLNDNVIADDYITTEQDFVDTATNALKVVLDKIANDTNGAYEKPDYTEVDKDLADAKNKAENNDVIDSVESDIKDIEDKLNEIKDDPTSNKKDDQPAVDALEKELEDIIAGIEDGSLIKPDYTEADKAIEDAEKDIDGGKLSDEDQKALDELKEKLDEIKNDPTSNKKENQDDVDEIKNAAQTIVDKYAECAKGNHTYTVKTVKPTCTEKGYDIHTCSLCGKSYKDNYVDSTGHTEQILPAKEPTCSSVGYTEGKKCIVCGEILVAQKEISTLPHTDEDNDGTCDVCGKTGLYDGCTCLCHNNHWFWRLVYLIFRLIWRLFKVHQICPCGAVHY